MINKVPCYLCVPVFSLLNRGCRNKLPTDCRNVSVSWTRQKTYRLEFMTTQVRYSINKCDTKMIIKYKSILQQATDLYYIGSMQLGLQQTTVGWRISFIQSLHQIPVLNMELSLRHQVLSQVHFFQLVFVTLNNFLSSNINVNYMLQIILHINSYILYKTTFIY